MDIAQLYELFKEHLVICTDSRKITPDCIYVSLRGENFDGNSFAIEALKKGASYSITDDKTLPKVDGLIRVEDGLKTLQNPTSI